jgi:hypothetical protein
MAMTDINKGWVVMNACHPRTKGKFIVGSTFSYTRTKAIEAFIKGSGQNWRYWKEKYNFSCVKATQSITI